MSELIIQMINTNKEMSTVSDEPDDYANDKLKIESTKNSGSQFIIRCNYEE